VVFFDVSFPAKPDGDHKIINKPIDVIEKSVRNPILYASHYHLLVEQRATSSQEVALTCCLTVLWLFLLSVMCKKKNK
jgi:hypothetical protein